MRIIKNVTISILMLLLFSLQSKAQENWTTFSKENKQDYPKLASIIFEDKQNNLWVASELGLYLYNGKDWEKISKKDGLRSSDVTAIMQHSDGTVWIGTKGGLSTYKNGILTKEETKLINGFPILYISCIYEDSKKNIWFGTGLTRPPISQSLGHSAGALVKYDGTKCTYISGFAFSPNMVLSGNHPVQEIMEDKNGDIWVASGWITFTNGKRIFAGHLSKYKDGNWEYYIDKIPYRNEWFINDIYKDKSGNLWFSAFSDEKTGCVIKYDGKEMTYYTASNGLLNYVNVYYEDSKGVFWFGGNRGLAYKLNDKYLYLRDSANNIIPANVKVIKEDSKRNIWIGTTNGIYVYANEGWKHFTNENELSGLSNNVQMIAEDFEGKIWVLTKNVTLTKLTYHISKINPENWKSEPIPLEVSNNSSKINAIFEDSNNNVWFISLNQTMKYSK